MIRKKLVQKIAAFVCKRLKIITAAAIFIFSVFLFLRFSPYPEFTTLLNQHYSTRIYDKNGYLVQILPLENGLRREWNSLKNIPKKMQKIIIQEEDKRFYFHNGVDIFAVCAAAVQNHRAGKTVRGASTITMQLAKSISKTGGGRRTVNQKIQDIFNALRIEARVSKKRILELYLNSISFGNNIEGITSAARSFYGKDIYNLSEEEMLQLAKIVRRPSSFTAEKYKYPFYMPHYVRYLQKINDEKLPYEVELTADLELQNFIQKLSVEALKTAENSRISNIAVLVLNNEDCSVLSWLGNANWFDLENGQVDGVLAENQPGSSMKPFLYALGLEKTQNQNQLFTPSSVLSDIQKEFGSENLYIPANFNNQFNGPVRYRVALASSLNIPAVQLLESVGVQNYLNLLYDLGFDSLKNEKGAAADLGLALGAGEVQLKELTTAFSVFARDGKYLPLKYFDNQKKSAFSQVYKKDTARIICSMLSDKAARATGFGYTQTFQTEYPSIFKTGTSNQFQDIVALGSTKRWTVGVWMGNFEGQTVVGKTGSSLPAWVAKQILDKLETENPVKKASDNNFAEPENYKKQKLCSLSGMTATEYCLNTVYEYVSKTEKKDCCSWHKEDGTYLPSEYQQWVRAYKKDFEVSWTDSELKIVSPKNGSVFYYDEGVAEKQALNVEVTGGTGKTLQVFYDSTEYGQFERPFVFGLPVERGVHSVKVICDKQKQDVFFTVK